jgi:HK97 family phage prohead protease
MSVVPFQDFPTSDQDTWDGGEAHKRAIVWVGGQPSEWSAGDWRKFRSVHLWYDSAAPDKLASYKFQVADIIAGSPRYVFRAASAALVRLRGSSGDWKAEAQGMEAHLKRIYAKFEKPFPSKAAAGLHETKDIQFEVKDLDAQGEGSFTGLLAVYDNVDAYGDVIRRGAFSRTLNAKSEIPILWSHDAREPIGLGRVEDTPKGLVLHGQLELSLPEAQKAYTRLKKKIVKGLSIGFETMKSVVKDGVRELLELKLYEGSLVTFPANELAVVTEVKALDFNSSVALYQPWSLMETLFSNLRSICCDDTLDPADILEQADTSIEQFRSAFAEALPPYLKARAVSRDEMNYRHRVVAETKAGRTISSATAERIRQAMQMHQQALEILQALLEGEPAKSTSPPEPAGSQQHADPDSLHSASKAALTALTRFNVKEVLKWSTTMK